MFTKRTFVLYSVWKIFKPTIVEASWNCKENNAKKMNALSNNCFLKMLFENPISLNMRLQMQPGFVTVDKMAGMFTKRIWQPQLKQKVASFTVRAREFTNCYKLFRENGNWSFD